MKTKEQLLAVLEENRGVPVSGEAIAERLSVSRAAVWKAVKELEKAGYVIHAATKKGYSLAEENDILSEQGIRAALQAAISDDSKRDSKIEGLHPEIFVYPSVDSTNIVAKQLAIGGATHGTVVIAESQTAGRGRFGRDFFSPPGCSVYMSVILRPMELRFVVPTLVTTMAAVAVCEAVESIMGDASENSPAPKIKWVNDVFLRGKKICGILSEAVTDFESGEIEWIVVGIGVNFREPKDGFPDEIKETAGAVFPEQNAHLPPVKTSFKTPTRNRLIAEIIERLHKLNMAGNADFMQSYRDRLMYIGEKVTVRGAGAAQAYEATALGVDDIGGLIVQTADGEKLTLSSGEVSVRG